MKHVKTKFSLALLLCLILCLVKLPASVAAESELNFRWILPPEFYRGNDFHNGRAWVQREQGGPWTLFDTEGNIIKDGFMARHVSQSANRNTHFVPLDADSEFEWRTVGFVDDYSGNILLEPKAYISSPPFFQDGIASRREENGLWGFIGFEGRWIIPPIYENFFPMQDGFIPARKDGKWGIIDRNGEVVIDFRFEGLSILGNGLFVAPYGSLYGLINMDGDWITEAVFDWFSHPHSSPHLIAARKNGRVGYLDANGNVVIDFRFACMEEIINLQQGGRLAVTRGIQRFGFSFNSGRAAVLLPAEGNLSVRWAVINESGDIIPTKQYDHIVPYRNGLALARRDNKRFFLDTEGREHPIPPEFVREGVSMYSSGGSRIFRAHFREEGKTGYWTTYFKVRD